MFTGERIGVEYLYHQNSDSLAVKLDATFRQQQPDEEVEEEAGAEGPEADEGFVEDEDDQTIILAAVPLPRVEKPAPLRLGQSAMEDNRPSAEGVPACLFLFCLFFSTVMLFFSFFLIDFMFAITL